MVFGGISTYGFRAIAAGKRTRRGGGVDEAFETLFVQGAGDAGGDEGVAAVRGGIGTGVLDDGLFAHFGA